ncbi:MAG: serine/threonine protein kinase [Proteobacteria bacterium]|nr:serine/threonine protein kinase [Pseudomonadota bacterium]
MNSQSSVAPKRLFYGNTMSACKCGVVLLLLTVNTYAGDWHRFRGPTGDGVVREAHVPLRWGTNQNVKWRTDLPGPGASSPIVSKGRIFLTCWSGYGQDLEYPGDPVRLKRHALCLDRKNGRILWNRVVPAKGPVPPFQRPFLPEGGYASSTAVSDGTNVFYFMAKRGVIAYTHDGKELWRTTLGNGWHDWGTGASAMLYQNLVIVNASVESSTLCALNKQDGSVAWRVPEVFKSYNTPLLVEAGGERPELVVAHNQWLRAFDPLTGAELWRCQAIKSPELCPSVVARDGVVYLVGGVMNQTTAVRAGGRGDVTYTHVLWTIKKGSNVSSPVFHDGRLFVANDTTAKVYCLDAAKGEIVWEQKLLERSERINASPILFGDRIYFLTRKHGMFVVQAGSEFNLIAQNPPLDPTPFNGSPAVSDGQIFLRSERAVYCIADN